MKQKLKHASLVLLALLVIAGVLFVTISPLADLKPEAITNSAQPDREKKGKDLLRSAHQAVGGERGETHPVARFDFRDHWSGIGKYFSPWPHENQRAVVKLKTHTFNSSVTFTNGDAKGTTWGIDDGIGWTIVDGKRAPSDNKELLFMLPTLHYFVELAQRLTEAPIVRWVEERKISGRSYDVVFATWETVAAHEKYDQYLIYIDKESRRIGKVQYTVREAFGLATGTCHLEDYKEIDGVSVSHKMSVTMEPEDSPEDYMHRMSIENFTWVSDSPN